MNVALVNAAERDGEKLIGIKFNQLVESSRKFTGKKFCELSEECQVKAFEAIEGTMKKFLDLCIMEDIKSSNLFTNEEVNSIHRGLKISMDVMLIGFETEMRMHFASKPSRNDCHPTAVQMHHDFMGEHVRQHAQYMHDEAARQHMEFAQNACMQAMNDSMAACNMHMNMF